jgi:hypothetical protein
LAFGIKRDTLHRTDFNALRVIKMPYAFGAFCGVNEIVVWAQVDRVVGALRLAHITINALIGDH